MFKKLLNRLIGCCTVTLLWLYKKPKHLFFNLLSSIPILWGERDKLFTTSKHELARFLYRRKRRFIRIFQEPKLLLKWVFYIIVLIKIKGTPKNIFKYLKTFFIQAISFFRTVNYIIGTHNLDHKDIKFYMILSIIIVFTTKILQEIHFNFSCPVALWLYGELVRTNRSSSNKKLDNRRNKVSGYRKPKFKDRAERLKALAKQEVLNNIKKLKMGAEINKWRVTSKKWKKRYPNTLKKIQRRIKLK